MKPHVHVGSATSWGIHPSPLQINLDVRTHPNNSAPAGKLKTAEVNGLKEKMNDVEELEARDRGRWWRERWRTREWMTITCRICREGGGGGRGCLFERQINVLSWTSAVLVISAWWWTAALGTDAYKHKRLTPDHLTCHMERWFLRRQILPRSARAVAT